MSRERIYWDYVSSGASLENQFLDNALPQSLFERADLLYYYGWEEQQSHDNETADGAPDPADLPKLAMYRELGLSPRPQHNMKVVLRHIQTKDPKVDRNYRDRYYEWTGAQYSCVYTPRAILAHASESPAEAGALRGIRGRDLVRLSHWSDVVYCRWLQFCRDFRLEPSSIRHIFQTDVTNPTTIDIVTDALGQLDRQLGRQLGQGLKYWPTGWPPRANEGITTFVHGTEEYRAVLATPNGVGPVHFVSQHRARLGRLMIIGVSVFCTAFSSQRAPFNMCFHVEQLGKIGQG